MVNMNYIDVCGDRAVRLEGCHDHNLENIYESIFQIKKKKKKERTILMFNLIKVNVKQNKKFFFRSGYFPCVVQG